MIPAVVVVHDDLPSLMPQGVRFLLHHKYDPLHGGPVGLGYGRSLCLQELATSDPTTREKSNDSMEGNDIPGIFLKCT
jgi:hypothetical protein